jgi:energy-coupling factor transporter ATP-binding protein EcfA2
MKASTSNAAMNAQDQSHTTHKRHIDPETIIFGRDSVIAEITQNLSKGQSTLLTGKLGLGKSHILKHISAKLTPTASIFQHPSPPKFYSPKSATACMRIGKTSSARVLLTQHSCNTLQKTK